MAVVGTRYFTPNQFEQAPTGAPYASARLFFYQTGTTTPLATYSDVNLTIPNANPITADASGRFGSIFLTPSTAYRVQLWTPATALDPVGSQVWSEDPVGPAAGGVVSSSAGMLGEVRAFAGPQAAIPQFWYMCFGQSVSRTAFAAAFSVLGTYWGAGDGSTTFNLPDLRGRALFGLDNMGAIPANRLTAGVCGVPGSTLGGAGGDQNLATHAHAIDDPAHVHGINDPGHVHRAGGTISVTAGGLGVRSISFTGADVVTTSALTGISMNAATTGVTTETNGVGSGANIPPCSMLFFIIYLGA